MTNEELALKIQNGDNAVIPQLWEQVERFIYKLALKWAGAYNRPDITAEDLYQSGYFALLDAVQRFEYGRGDFLSVLSFSLKNAFSDALKWRINRHPQDASFYCVSLNAPVQGAEDATLEDNIPDDHDAFEDVEERLYQQQAAVVLRKAVGSIPERQSVGISLYYLQGKTQRETAEQLNVSGSRAQQIIKEGLKSLRKSVYAPALTELFYNDQNFFKHTGYTYWKHNGMSAPERAVIFKERIESQYSSAQWGGKVSLLVKLGYPIEKAQVIATMDSRTA